MQLTDEQIHEIEMIIQDAYGDTEMSEKLVAHLVGRIESDWCDYKDRERQIMLTCWDWMTGGTTAESVAYKIEQALAS